MFEIGILILLKNILINIFVPICTGILIMWIFFGSKFKGILLYVISFFIGVGIISAALFNLQFFYFGVGVFEYFSLNIVLLGILILKSYLQKKSLSYYLSTLKLSCKIKDYKKSFLQLNVSKKILTLLSIIFVSWFTIVAFIFNANFPTYGDDSFGNWHTPAINIYNDGGFKIIGEKEDILGNGRLGYPIYIPTYKALISDFNGGFNDIYINLLQLFSFLMFLIFIFVVSYKKTSSLYLSLLPLVLICGLPLVFFHAVEGYMEMLSIIYVVISIYYIWLYLEKDDFDYLLLGLIFGFILMNIKNEGLVVYFSGITFAFLSIILLNKKFKGFIKSLFKNNNYIYKILGFFAFITLPFLLVKQYYSLGFNQAAGVSEGVGISSSIHFEIFNYFPPIFFSQDNYNVSLILIIIFSFIVFSKLFKKKKIDNLLFPYLSFIFIFIIFILVFLLTDNYKRVLNQTTVNRVFTTSFIVLFSFSGMYVHNYYKIKK